jgi:hypothetical protein
MFDSSGGKTMDYDPRGEVSEVEIERIFDESLLLAGDGMSARLQEPIAGQAARKTAAHLRGWSQ